MPWRDVGTVDLRMELVTDYRRGFATVTELAASYGISRGRSTNGSRGSSARDRADWQISRVGRTGIRARRQRPRLPPCGARIVASRNGVPPSW